MRYVIIDDSSHIKEIAYDRKSHSMYVKFDAGSVYEYKFVHPDIFGAIVSAESVGTVFSENVRFNSNIPYSEMEEMPEVEK